MASLDPPFRLANRGDAPRLAELINMAGDGLPFHVWKSIAWKGEDPWRIGRKRQADRSESGEVVVAETSEGVVGSLTGTTIGFAPLSIPDHIPALFRPLIELENLSLGTWYINAIAIYPKHRGRGLLQGFLRLSEHFAHASGMSALSAIVAGNKTGPIKVYERMGFRIAGTRKFEPGDWDAEFDNWVLLTKDI